MSISAAKNTQDASVPVTRVTSQFWGHTEQRAEVNLYTLANDQLQIVVSNYGARIVSVLAKDRDGDIADIVLGYNSLAEYEADTRQYFGATIGRFANRIANGRFSIDGTAYQVPQNNGTNALHGGTQGFDRRVWETSLIPGGVEMKLESPDGDMGFPGAMTVCVTYSLIGSDLTIDYHAATTQKTVVNLTNHSYFNLAGESDRTVLAHIIRIAAEHYTPITEKLIPSGELLLVENTPFDLRSDTAIGAHIHAENEQLKVAGGYDHKFRYKQHTCARTTTCRSGI